MNSAPEGWYYYGSQPPWAGGNGPHPGPGAHDRHHAGATTGAHHDAPSGAPYGSSPPAPDNSDLMEAFDRLAKGDLSAETLNRLFNLGDRDFWKGALVGAGAALALSNLPALKMAMAAMMASAGSAKAPRPWTGSDHNQDDDAPESAED